LNWALYYPTTIALVAGLASAPEGHRLRDGAGFLLACVPCIAILGLGAVLQPILQEVLFPLTTKGLVYNLQFSPQDFLTASTGGLLRFGLMVGPLLAFILTRTRGGESSLNAVISATLCLTVTDVWQNAVANNFRGFGGDLLFSLLSDIIGGPIGGFLCGPIVRGISDLQTGEIRWKFIGRVALGAFIFVPVAGAAISAGYLLMVQPRTENVLLTIRKWHSMNIIYSTTQTWSFPVSDASISGAFNYSIHVASSGPITAQIMAAQDCDSMSAAAQQLRDSSISAPATPVDLAGQTLSIVGGITSVAILPVNPKSLATVQINSGTNVQMLPRSDQPGRTFRFFGDAKMSASLDASTLILISSNAPAPITVNSALGERKANYIAALTPADGQGCRLAPLFDPKQKAQTGATSIAKNILAIKITSDVNPGTLVDVTLAGTTLELPLDAGLVQRIGSTSLASFASSLEADVDDGSFSVGSEHRPMYPNDHVTLAGSMTINQGEDAMGIVVNGNLAYVLLNGSSLTKGIFWYIGPELEVFVLGGIVAGISLLLNRWRGRIRNAMIF
jgi:hypothetical protein